MVELTGHCFGVSLSLSQTRGGGGWGAGGRGGVNANINTVFNFIFYCLQKQTCFWQLVNLSEGIEGSPKFLFQLKKFSAVFVGITSNSFPVTKSCCKRRNQRRGEKF